MQAEFWKQIKAAISEPRFESYRGVPTSSDEEALANYLWNQSLSESLYPVFQTLEVTYRNSLHSALSAAFGRRDWLQHTPLVFRPQEMREIEEAKEKLRTRKKPETEPYLVSELKFGFWTSLADTHYELMWRKIIKPVFPQMPNSIRTRAEISSRINSVRKLRNAAMHHHSIWHWKDLEQKHASACDLIGWINAHSLATLKKVDRFQKTFSDGNGPLKRAVSDMIR